MIEREEDEGGFCAMFLFLGHIRGREICGLQLHAGLLGRGKRNECNDGTRGKSAVLGSWLYDIIGPRQLFYGQLCGGTTRL